MKAGKFVVLPLLAVGMSFTPAAFAAENSKPTPQVEEAPFLLQVPLANDTYRLTSNFGVRMNPETKEKTLHNGIDYAAPKGTPIYAAADGVVIMADRANGYGETIMIKHHSDFTTLYAHILPGSFLVKNGDTVKKGQKIAEVGSSEATGSHLHFSVFKKDTAVNPSDYFGKTSK